MSPSQFNPYRSQISSMKTKLTGLARNLIRTAFLSCAVAAASEPTASPEVTAAMQPYLDSYKLAGVIGIVADKTGKVHYKNLLGFADVEAKKPISEDNVFWIASMTKMFAGASIMMLVDEGKVSLDDPVTKFIPQLSKWMVVEEKDAAHVLLKPPVRPVTELNTRAFIGMLSAPAACWTSALPARPLVWLNTCRTVTGRTGGLSST